MSIAELSRLSFFMVGKYEYQNGHICNFMNIPRPHFCIGLLINGTAVFTPADGRNISIKPGDIIFVPITSRYISRWHGTPDVFYISMHFAFEPSCGISEQQRFELQSVTLPDFDILKEKFAFTLDYYNADEASQMASLGAFYDVLSQVLPKLRHKKEQALDERIEKAVEYINLNSEKKLTVSELADLSCMSVPNFHVQFKKYLSMTPIEYKNHIVIGRAMRLLKAEDNLSVEQLGEMLGFESSTYFRRVFKKITGKTPLEYRKSKMEL